MPDLKCDLTPKKQECKFFYNFEKIFRLTNKVQCTWTLVWNSLSKTISNKRIKWIKISKNVRGYRERGKIKSRIAERGN